MPLGEKLSENLDAPADPARYVSILVLYQAIEDAAGRGPHLTAAEQVDAAEFVRGDWRCQLWCDAAGVHPRLVRETAQVAPPRPKPERKRRLTAELVRQMRAERAAGARAVDLQRKYGLGKNTCWDVLTGRTWREVA